MSWMRAGWVLAAPELIARVFGVFMTLVLAAISLGAYVSPLLLDWIGIDSTLVALVPGAFTFLGLSMFYWRAAFRRIRFRDAASTPGGFER